MGVSYDLYPLVAGASKKCPPNKKHRDGMKPARKRG